MENRKYYELPEVLLAELECILKNRSTGEAAADVSADVAPLIGNKPEKMREVFSKLHEADLSALCLSGGGIRSATFSLGVLQGLARKGLLERFDFLSTVSGGGYIGSWLSSWIHRAKGGRAEVFGELAKHSLGQSIEEPRQVKFLRDYSNYLTPRAGLFSMDTWSIIAIYLRNLLLNWLILLPLFFAFLLLPRLFTAAIHGWASSGANAGIMLKAAFICGLLPIAYTVRDLPSMGNARREKWKFAAYFLAPLIAMAVLLSLYEFATFSAGQQGSVFAFAGFGGALHLGGAILGLLICLFYPLHGEDIDKVPNRETFLWFSVAAVLTGAVAGLGAWLCANYLLPLIFASIEAPAVLYALLSLPVILLLYAITGILVIAILSRWTKDHDREWWGRSGAAILIFITAWLVVSATVLYGPWLFLPPFRFWHALPSLITVIAGPVVAYLGKSSATPAARPGVSPDGGRNMLLQIGGVLFLLLLGAALSAAATVILNGWDQTNFTCHLGLLGNASGGNILIAGFVAVVVAGVAGVFVNINKFSMHAMYRNRLVRCYLGASHRRRKPNPFTGFDPADNIAMDRFCLRPYHVVNMTWNLVKGQRLAWQQRKAASFIMTPLHAGGDLRAEEKNGLLPGGFRSSAEYAAGRDFRNHLSPGSNTKECEYGRKKNPLSLGTAMAISGAAASPNMGYHSSPLITFVMALFNVRLGWWLGNPGKGMGNAWQDKSPLFAVWPLFKETFGLTNECSREIYLSDGGHFENLALYEMVRRRCHFIVVCDGGCDRDRTFDDLGNAIRKIRVDLGVEITIKTDHIAQGAAHFAIGTIKYTDCDGRDSQDGTLLYIKPVVTGDEPVDVLNYGKTHGAFPHETTADQWFDEAQFESYRRLGLHSVDVIADAGNGSLGALFANARGHLANVGTKQYHLRQLKPANR